MKSESPLPPAPPAAAKRARFAGLLDVLLTSLVCQIVFLTLLPRDYRDTQSSDSVHFYIPVAENIVASKGITLDGAQLATRYPPGYPLTLAGVYAVADACACNRTVAVVVFNVLATELGCLFLFLLMECAFGARVATISGLLWASYPFAIWLVKQPNSEVVFIPLLYLGLWLLVRGILRARAAFAPAAGLVLGLAALVRPIGLFLGVILSAVVLFWPAVPRTLRLRFAVLLLAGFTLAILPWEVHVARATGQVIPLSTGARPSLLDGLTFALGTGYSGDRAPVSGDVRVLMERIRSGSAAWPGVGGLLHGVAHEALHAPAAAARLLLLKAGRSWYATDEMWYERLILGVQALYLVPALAGVWLGLRRGAPGRGVVALLLMVVCYFWAMTLTMLSIVRYMVPVMGLLFGLAALGGVRLLALRRPDRPPAPG